MDLTNADDRKYWTSPIHLFIQYVFVRFNKVIKHVKQKQRKKKKKGQIESQDQQISSTEHTVIIILLLLFYILIPHKCKYERKHEKMTKQISIEVNRFSVNRTSCSFRFRGTSVHCEIAFMIRHANWQSPLLGKSHLTSWHYCVMHSSKMLLLFLHGIITVTLHFKESWSVTFINL